ncbi:MAG: ABC transporter permease, partial [Bacteroidetes bacterium]|nr:ABC transporter permease [Bacteroidota bacterium]
MNNPENQTHYFFAPWLSGINRLLFSVKLLKHKDEDKVLHPFRVILNKEISDHVRSWRFIILIALIALTCMGSMYTALTNIDKAVKPNDPEGTFFFLKLFTITDGTLPSFVVFISFLGPLLGISMGFDAVNSEHNHRTLSRVLAQPIYRDYLLNAKFLAALVVISVMFFALVFLVMGLGLITIGIPPTAEEFLRIVSFVVLSVLYVAFWLNLSILFSVRFRQPATSALAGIAVWLFFSVFYGMIVNLITRALAPSSIASEYQLIGFEQFKLSLLRLMPNQLFTEATTTLLMPSV